MSTTNSETKEENKITFSQIALGILAFIVISIAFYAGAGNNILFIMMMT